MIHVEDAIVIESADAAMNSAYAALTPADREIADEAKRQHYLAERHEFTALGEWWRCRAASEVTAPVYTERLHDGRSRITVDLRPIAEGRATVSEAGRVALRSLAHESADRAMGGSPELEYADDRLTVTVDQDQLNHTVLRARALSRNNLVPTADQA